MFMKWKDASNKVYKYIIEVNHPFIYITFDFIRKCVITINSQIDFPFAITFFCRHVQTLF